MKVKEYVKDKMYVFFLFTGIYGIQFLLLLAFKIDKSVIYVFSVLQFILLFALLNIDYIRKKRFYNQLLDNIKKLDKAYLILETIEKPVFYEGKLMVEVLYEINKSMREMVKSLEIQQSDFKEYIEMWIHEVKIPIASLLLMAHNHKEKWNKSMILQLHRVEEHIEQVLYYTRSENASTDYLIKEVNLENIIHKVALKNKDELLENKIDFQVENVNYQIYTDAKWLEFILNQIINNSIKYAREKVASWIKMKATEEDDKIRLSILDNGIGIKESDRKRVFEKTFTGYNGRIKASSTGMGLFIAKNLCEKLGHKISLESKENEFTKVTITFYKNKYYEVLK